MDINFRLPNGRFAMLSSVRTGFPVRIEPGAVWYAEPSDSRLVNEAEFAKLLAALRGQKIYGLKLTDDNAPKNASAHLGELTSLKILISIENRLTKSGLDVIATLPALEHLHLHEPKIKPRDLASLAQAKNLKVLTLERIEKANPQDLKFLQQIPKLERLICIRCRFKQADIQGLGLDKRVKIEFR